jgi:hypothetical protein
MNINYNTKEQYIGIITTISDQYNSILTEYKKFYIAVNNNNSTTNTKNFDNSSALLVKKYNELVKLQSEISDLNKRIVSDVTDLNSKIKTEKVATKDFKKKLTALAPINSSSNMLISDYNENYNDKNTKNWSLLIGILVSCAMIIFIFRIPTTKDQMLRVKEETITKLYKEGSDYASKYQALKEKGKQKAAEAERILSYNIQRVKEYKKRADELVKEQAEAAAVKAPTVKKI